MNYSTAERIGSLIETLKDALRLSASNRALINELFNGFPPYTKAEVAENHIQINVNWGEGADLLLAGREQFETAFLSSDFFFTVNLPDAPTSKQKTYSDIITKKINALMKKSRPFLHTQRSKWGSVALHGPGSVLWEDQWGWKPFFAGVDDLLIPPNTELPLTDLNHFALARRMSRRQLFNKTFGKPDDKRDPGWQMKAVGRVLDDYKDINESRNEYNWADNPEKMVEQWKQTGYQFENAAVPRIPMWDFYYQDDEDPEGRWFRKIILDKYCITGRGYSENPIEFIYDSKKPFASRIDEIIHIQFSDGNNVPPFMYHSVRSLGQRLYDAVHMLNRMRCQFMQKVLEDMMLLFRAQDPVDRSRLDKIYMGLNYAIIPEGLSFVTRDQRYSPDPRLVEMQMSQLKQLLGEGSNKYTQDIDTGTNKERTAFEVQTLLAQTTRLTSSMLNLAYLQEGYLYEEICRRLTLKKTPDFEARKFQNELMEEGVPVKWIDSARWEIQPVRVLGNGSPQLEQAQAQALLNVRPLLPPPAQAEVLNDYVFSVTHDPKRASRLAPVDAAPQVTDTVHDSELTFGTLMQGVPVSPKAGLNGLEVVATILRLMATKIQQLTQTGNMATQQDIIGLSTAAQYVGQWLQQLSQDKSNAQFVKMASDSLGKMMNAVKGFAQRLQQAKQEQNGNQMDPETMVKLKGQVALTAQKLRSKELSDRQKRAQKNANFAAEERRKNLKTVGEIHRDTVTSTMEAARTPIEEEPASEE